MEKAVELQKAVSPNIASDYYAICNDISLDIRFGSASETEQKYVDETMALLATEHPEVDPVTFSLLSSPTAVFSSESVSSIFTSFDAGAYLDSLGFTTRNGLALGSAGTRRGLTVFLSDESYLDAFKLNALYALDSASGCYMNPAEQTACERLDSIQYSMPSCSPPKEGQDFSDFIEMLKDPTTPLS